MEGWKEGGLAMFVGVNFFSRFTTDQAQLRECLPGGPGRYELALNVANRTSASANTM